MTLPTAAPKPKPTTPKKPSELRREGKKRRAAREALGLPQPFRTTQPSGKPIKKKARKPSEFQRIYGSKQRVTWMKLQPCVARGSDNCCGHIEGHHVITGGTRRKADAKFIAPLCEGHHDELHQHGRLTFQQKHGVDLIAEAAHTQTLWLLHVGREQSGMRFAYADPPYLGTSSFGAVHHYGHQHENAKAYDSIEAHRDLVGRLAEFDGWALSLHSPSLRLILPLCPDDVRVGAWVKPFASFKPGVNPGYCWEPVIYRGARTAKQRRGKSAPTVRDFVSANIIWLFELLGLTVADEFIDLFNGSGATAEAHAKWAAQRTLTDGAA